MFDPKPGLPEELTEALHLHQIGAIALILGIIILAALIINRARQDFNGDHGVFEHLSWVAGGGAVAFGALFLIA
ncbi:hypothetical protein [Corynebacterium sp.]|uniref:hypothetical protein n=1 Tax=Corynebacterium sp. TaxID=1720 RepID=UPI003B3BD252